MFQTLAGSIAYSLAGGITTEADDLSNNLIIVTPPRNEKMLREIIEKIDVESMPPTSSEVIGLKHSDVQSVFKTLESIVTGKANSSGGGSSSAASSMRNSGSSSLGGAASTQVNTYNTYSFTNRVVSSTGGIRASGTNAATPLAKPDTANSFSEYVTVTADERTNRLMLFGTAGDLKQLRELVAKLDVPLSQIRIEAVIVEVILKDGEASGLSTLGFGVSTFSGSTTDSDGTRTLGTGTGSRYGYNHPTWSANTTTPSNPLGGTPFTGNFTIAPDGLDISVILQQAESNSRARILSAPLINTSHNQPATIFVGETRPSITSSTNYYNSTGTSSSSIESRKFGIQLSVTPRVGADGSVEMKVDQTSNNVSGTTVIDGNEQWITSERSASSYLRAHDNQTVVLAGLQSYQEIKTHGVMWLLGYLPVIGRFFQPETTSTDRTELIIFLKPHIVDMTKEKLPNDTTPGFTPNSLTRADATNYVNTGRFAALSLTEDEREAIAEIRKREHQNAADTRRHQLKIERDTAREATQRDAVRR
jgi:general secretion pathway protein D